MGWKNLKEHYRIVHTVQVTEDGICIGSPYIHDIIVISMAGDIVKSGDRTLNQDLQRYHAEMHADPEQLRRVVQAEDTFNASIPVFTYKGAEIIEKRCEELGWPNVTHDGAMMYENTFFAEREKAIEAARHNCEAAIMLRRLEISDKRKGLNKSISRLKELLANARELGIAPGPEADCEKTTCPICAVALKDDDICATDIELGICHAECLEGAPVVDLETGDEIPDGKVDTYRFGSEDTANG